MTFVSFLDNVNLRVTIEGVVVNKINFDKDKFLKEIRTFIKKNDLTIREFVKLAQCSPKTLYPGKDEMHISTVNKLQKAMDDYLKEVV